MISGELPQSERERVMNCIRQDDLHILVATDLAARGIDISHLSHVINFSLPEDPPVYLHRVGRTGRVGRQGMAISLVSGSRVRTLGVLERQFKIKFQERHFPTKEDMVNQRCASLVEDLVKEAEYAICDGYLAQASAVLEYPNARQVVAYMLKKRADEIHDKQRPKANRPPPQRNHRSGPRSRPKHHSKRRR
jgi:ATP-dependent RNA helicase DeaD